MEPTSTEGPDAGGIDWFAVANFLLVIVFNSFLAIILYIVGVFGNIMSIVIFVKRAKIDRVSSQYLGLLAASDLAYLITTSIVSWFKNDLPHVVRFFGSDVHIITMTSLTCKIWMYTMNVLSLISSWTLIVFSIERALVMWMPLRMAPVFSSSKPRKIALSLVVVCAVLLCTAHFHLITKRPDGYCSAHETPLWQNTLARVLYFGLPYVVPLVHISILNMLIVFGIRRNTMTTESNKSNKTERRCIINLLLVSFFFFVLISPVTVMDNLYYYYQSTGFAGLSAEYLAYFSIISYTSQTIANLNSAINPFIYTYSLDFYRKELMRILCFRKAKQGVSMSTETAITDAND